MRDPPNNYVIDPYGGCYFYIHQSSAAVFILVAGHPWLGGA